MSVQLPLPFINEKIYYIPEFINCEYHDDWAPLAFYSEAAIIKMIDEQGFIDCPYCLCEIVGIEGF